MFALKSYYGNNSPTNNTTSKEWNSKILKCPTDRWLEWRSYLINGWNDYFQQKMGVDWKFDKIAGSSMSVSEIPNPTETILFGEKDTASAHFYMDFLETAAGNDFEELEHARHSGLKSAGGSNFAFADGSARYLKYGRSVTPENLWAVIDSWRHNTAGIKF